MYVPEVMAAWKEAQACETHDFYEKFYHLTGLDEATVKRRFSMWNLLPHEQAVAIAERNGVTVEEAGFQAYLVEVFWEPPDERSKLLRQIARYLRMNADADASAAAVDNILDCEMRIGRPPIPFIMAEVGPEGHGDPREHKDWPPEEDCPGCPSGRVGVGEGHKMACTVAGAWQLVVPARMDEDGNIHVDILTTKG
jgi:hypothetical protein